MQPSSNQQTLQTILLGIFILLVLHALYRSARLYRMMEQLEPAYYDAIGRPSYTSNSVRQQLRTTMFELRLLFTYPKDFPDNTTLRTALARQRRFAYAANAVWLLLAVLVLNPTLLA